MLLLKLFILLIKTPLEKTGCFSNLYYLLAAQTSTFLLHHPSLSTVISTTVGTLHFTMHPLCDLHNPMTRHWSPCASQPFHGKQTIFLEVASILRMCLCPHFLGYLQQV